MKRSVRRICVVVYYLALFALYPLLNSWGWEMVFFLGFLFVSPAQAAGTELLKALNEPDSKVDERQRQLINEVMSKAYFVFAFVLIVPALLLGYTDDMPAQAGEAVATYISGHLFSFFVLTLLVTTIPPAILMWLEPDPIGEERIVEGLA